VTGATTNFAKESSSVVTEFMLVNVVIVEESYGVLLLLAALLVGFPEEGGSALDSLGVRGIQGATVAVGSSRVVKHEVGRVERKRDVGHVPVDLWHTEVFNLHKDRCGGLRDDRTPVALLRVEGELSDRFKPPVMASH
jgi:hypothetical protein